MSKKKTVLLKLIEAKSQVTSGFIIQPVVSLGQVAKQLENELKLCKEECAKWFIKYEILLKEHGVLQLAFEREMQRNSALGEKIIQLKKQVLKIVPNE
ncbi:MAG: hypothetical protein ABS949_10290 [Solibacillus sp.]